MLSRWRALWVLIPGAAAYLWWQEVYNSALPPQGSTTLSGIKYALRLGWDIMPGGRRGLRHVVRGRPPDPRVLVALTLCASC